MAKKKLPKIEPIPRDVIEKALAKPGFMYAPKTGAYGLTRCPGCENGHVIWVGTSSKYDFICSHRCGWECPDLELVKAYKAKIKAAKPKPKAKKKVISKPDSPKLVAAIRAEAQRRHDALLAERAKFPPTNVKKGKGKKAKWVPNPAFTDEMRAQVHKLAYSVEDIRKQILTEAK